MIPRLRKVETGVTETEAPTKKSKSTMTAEQQMLSQKFKPPLSKVDKKLKTPLRHVEGRPGMRP